MTAKLDPCRRHDEDRAQRNRQGPPADQTQKPSANTTKGHHLGSLWDRRPSHEPRATSYIPVMWKPASTIRISPVILRDAGLKRNVAASATSLVSMLRRSGVRSR
jgi:hypothetical protein